MNWKLILQLSLFGLAMASQPCCIRVALGANHRDIVWLVERRGLILAGLGITIGDCSPRRQYQCSRLASPDSAKRPPLYMLLFLWGC